MSERECMCDLEGIVCEVHGSTEERGYITLSDKHAQESARLRERVKELEARNVQLVEALKKLIEAEKDDSFEDPQSTEGALIVALAGAKQALAANEESGKMGKFLEAVRDIGKANRAYKACECPVLNCGHFEAYMDAVYDMLDKAKAAGVS